MAPNAAASVVVHMVRRVRLERESERVQTRGYYAPKSMTL